MEDNKPKARVMDLSEIETNLRKASAGFENGSMMFRNWLELVADTNGIQSQKVETRVNDKIKDLEGIGRAHV